MPCVEGYLPVVRVVHVVVDGVESGARACITSRGATAGWRGFRRGVVHHVPHTGAPALEGMIEANPMSSFVCEGLCSG